MCIYLLNTYHKRDRNTERCIHRYYGIDRIYVVKWLLVPTMSQGDVREPLWMEIYILEGNENCKRILWNKI